MAENNNESINMQFIEAIENGNTELVKELLADPRIDINFKTKKGEMTPLMYACSGFDNEEIVKLLLAVPGIDVNLTSKNFGSDNEQGPTALYWAIQEGNTKIVKLLLAVPGIKLISSTYTPLLLAVFRKNVDIARMLLIAGANTKVRGGRNIIDYALGNAMQELLLAPSATLMIGKTNRGVIDIPDDNKTNGIDLDDITDGEIIVRIKQFGKDFFYRLENWKNFMNDRLKNYPREPIKNPANREIVTADQIDIFTAHIVPKVNNAPVVGSKRPRPANLRGGTRRRRTTRRAKKQKRSTRRRR